MMPFQGKIWYWVEDSYGAGESGTTYPVSSYVQSVRIGTGDKGKDLRSIHSATVINRVQQTNEPVISVEYNPQVGDTLIEHVVERSSCCTLKSLAFCVGANTCVNDGDDASWFYVVGTKGSSIKISSSKNEPYTVSVDFEAKSITTGEVGSEPSALTGDILQFNVAGSISKAGGHVVDGGKIAYITESIDITIDNQLTSYTDHDSLVKSYLIEGTMDVSGTVDISLDNGGALHMGEVLDFENFSITVNMGGTGAPKLTFSSCYWDRSEVDVNVSGEAMMENAPFTHVSGESTCSGIVGTV
jgi:hypothetical protein